MPHKDPLPNPGIERPKKDKTVKCPNCGTVNYVTLEQILKGFSCHSCGQKVDGIKPSAPGPDDPWIIEEDK